MRLAMSKGRIVSCLYRGLRQITADLFELKVTVTPIDKKNRTYNIAIGFTKDELETFCSEAQRELASEEGS